MERTVLAALSKLSLEAAVPKTCESLRVKVAAAFPVHAKNKDCRIQRPKIALRADVLGVAQSMTTGNV